MQSPNTALTLGKMVQLSGNTLKAAGIFEKIAEKFPSDFRAFYNRAACLVELGRMDDALKSLKAALDTGDECPVEVYGALGKVLISLMRPEEAVDMCRRGLALTDGMDPVCLSNINVALRMLGQIDEAVTLSWSAMKLPPFDPVQLNLQQLSPYPARAPAPSSSSSSSSSSPPALVVAVKWGTKYGPNYVNNMYNMLEHHGFPDRNFKLLCFTDDVTGLRPEVVTAALPVDELPDWKGWWLKAFLFSPAATNAMVAVAPHTSAQTVLYLDLDTIVCGPLDFLLHERSGPSFSTLGAAAFPTEGRACGYNSSIMIWSMGGLHVLYAFLVEHYRTVTKVLFKFDHWLEMMVGSDAHCIEDSHPSHVVDYATLHGDRAMSILDAREVAVICFPLLPKPHELPADSDWAQVWRGEW